jgi:heterodisulfide reductase subunit A-like polyferredoxin
MNKTNKNNDIGAVMVVGGGIAGIQASLDLADSGYYVYLGRNWTRPFPRMIAPSEFWPLNW